MLTFAQGDCNMWTTVAELFPKVQTNILYATAHAR